MQLSVVIPVYNEAKNIAPLVAAVRDALDGKMTYELIIVDDGSVDDTVKNTYELLRNTDHCVELNRNYGQSAAMAAGIDQAVGIAGSNTGW